MRRVRPEQTRLCSLCADSRARHAPGGAVPRIHAPAQTPPAPHAPRPQQNAPSLRPPTLLPVAALQCARPPPVLRLSPARLPLASRASAPPLTPLHGSCVCPQTCVAARGARRGRGGRRRRRRRGTPPTQVAGPCQGDAGSRHKRQLRRHVPVLRGSYGDARYASARPPACALGLRVPWSPGLLFRA